MGSLLFKACLIFVELTWLISPSINGPNPTIQLLCLITALLLLQRLIKHGMTSVNHLVEYCLHLQLTVVPPQHITADWLIMEISALSASTPRLKGCRQTFNTHNNSYYIRSQTSFTSQNVRIIQSFYSTSKLKCSITLRYYALIQTINIFLSKLM